MEETTAGKKYDIILEYDKVKFREYHSMLNEFASKDDLYQFADDIASTIRRSVGVAESRNTITDISQFRGSGKATHWSRDAVSRFVALAMHTRANRSRCLEFIDRKDRMILSMAFDDVIISDAQIRTAGLGNRIKRQTPGYSYRSVDLPGNIWYMFDYSDLTWGYSSCPEDDGVKYVYGLKNCFRLLLAEAFATCPDEPMAGEAPSGTEVRNAEADASVVFPVIRMALKKGELKYQSGLKATEASARKILGQTTIADISADLKAFKYRHNVGQFTLPLIDMTIGYHYDKPSPDKSDPKYCDIVRSIIGDLRLYKPEYLLPMMLPHLKMGSRDLEEHFQATPVAYALDFIAGNPDRWITPKIVTDNIIRSSRHLIRNMRDLPYNFLTSKVTDRMISWTTYRRTVEEAVVRSMFAMLYGLGAAEVACSEPDGKDTVSSYGHIEAIRLTALGRYAFGLESTYELKAGDDVRYFEFDAERLVIRSLVRNNPYVGVLQNIAVPFGNSRFIVSPESFLRNCRKTSDIDDNVRFLKNYLCADMPKVWTDFFDVISQRCHPFTEEATTYTVLHLDNPSDQNLIHIIGTDPEIRSMVLKVEGMKLLVPSGKMPAFSARMKHFGYLL